MARIPYPEESELSDEARELLTKVPPLNVTRMFAGAPASLRPMLDLGRSILLESELDPRLRELAILAVAHATASGYERFQHEALSRALGIPDAEIDAIAAGRYDGLDPEARLVTTFADEVARNGSATEERTTAVLELLGRRQATELVVCCAYYSAVARIIATCGVELEDVSPIAGMTAEDAERLQEG
jgi:alkylhydroperoxidase family enzyme